MSCDVQTFCITLTPPGAASEAARTTAADRGWQLIAIDDPLAAMAEVVLRERAQAARSGWGLPRVDRVVFMIVEPRSWDACDDLAAAMSQYLPGVERFALTDGRLSPLVQTPAESATRRRLPGLPPMMRRAAAPRTMRGAGPEPAEGEADGDPVSREELEILLGTSEEQP